jgi:tetratricopeptide (TPR) repeat protein
VSKTPGVLLAVGLVLMICGCSADRVPETMALPDLEGADVAVAAALREAHAVTSDSPGDAEAWVSFADLLAAHGYRLEAATAYRLASVRAPTEPRWIYLEAQARRGLDLDAAIAGYERVVRMVPDNPVPRIRLARAYLTTGRIDEAAAQLSGLSTNDPWVAAALAVIAENRGDIEAAIEASERALQAEPGMIGVRRSLAGLYRRMGEAERGRQLLADTPSVGEPVMPDPWLVRPIEALGALALAEQGAELEDRGELDAAVDRYRDALTQQPDRHEVWIRLARALSASGREEEALDSWRQAVRLRPRDAEVLAGLGRSLLRTGSPQEARPFLEQAVMESEAAPAGVWMDLGLARAEAGAAKEAIEALQRASDLASDDAEIHYNLGIVLAQTGDFSAAQYALERALKLDPNDLQTTAALRAVRERLPR